MEDNFVNMLEPEKLAYLWSISAAELNFNKSA